MKQDEQIEALVKKFLKLRPGQSFFFENTKRRDIEFLRKPFVAAGAGIEIAETHADEIFGVAGTRVWRRAGEYDEL